MAGRVLQWVGMYIVSVLTLFSEVGSQRWSSKRTGTFQHKPTEWHDNCYGPSYYYYYYCYCYYQLAMLIVCRWLEAYCWTST